MKSMLFENSCNSKTSNSFRVGSSMRSMLRAVAKELKGFIFVAFRNFIWGNWCRPAAKVEIIIPILYFLLQGWKCVLLHEKNDVLHNPQSNKHNHRCIDHTAFTSGSLNFKLIPYIVPHDAAYHTISPHRKGSQGWQEPQIQRPFAP